MCTKLRRKNGIEWMAVAVVCTLVVVCPAFGKVIYVDDDAPTAGDGASWDKAYRFLQDGLGSADAGDEIRVAQGVYKPDRSAAKPEGSRDRSASFKLKGGMILKGGYAGLGAVDPNARDALVYQTILSGDLAGNDVEVTIDVNNPYKYWHPTWDENSYYIINVVDLGANPKQILVDGFLVIGASWTAMRMEGANVFVKDCGFLKDYGGAIFAKDVIANGCRFQSHGISISAESIIAGGCRFVENYNTVSGKEVFIQDCVFVRCRSESEWGIITIDRGGSKTSVVQGCRFYGNTSRYTSLVFGWDSESPMVVSNCIFSGNLSPSLIGSRECSVKNCTFSNNRYGQKASYVIGTNHLANCIIWDQEYPLTDSVEWNGTMTYSATLTAWPGEGNIEVIDPMFMDADGPDNIIGTEDDDLRLLPGSPCINRGNNAAMPSTLTTDLAGRPRIIGIVDMGAYENGALWYADALSGNNENEGNAPVRAFKTIQKAVNVAGNGDEVLVYPGIYAEQVDIPAKELFIRGIPGPLGIAVIQAPDATAFHLTGAQTRGPGLENLVIRNSRKGIEVSNGSAYLRNLTIVGNDQGITADANAQPQITNCILWNNQTSDLTNCQATYSCIQRSNETAGVGNITDDPLFADLVGGDYHLKSQRGRSSQVFGTYVQDPVTSRCIDAGDPLTPVGLEPSPNGHRINIGAYGGTLYASLSPQFPPSVSIVSPKSGEWFGRYFSLEIRVQASDMDGEVVAVECRVNGETIGQAAKDGVPWKLYWISSTSGTYILKDGVLWKLSGSRTMVGTYTLTAVAVDDQGNRSMSDPVTIQVKQSSGGGGR